MKDSRSEEQGSEKPTLVGNDILFTCRHCGKNLVIDCHGAGLNISCPQCHKDLEVPVPEGFDITQLDKEITSVNLLVEDEAVTPTPAVEVEVPAEVLEQVKNLQTELKSLRMEKQQYIQQHADLLNAVKEITQQMDEFRKMLDRLDQLTVLSPAAGGENQKGI
jgi:phage FluMu protein Com